MNTTIENRNNTSHCDIQKKYYRPDYQLSEQDESWLVTVNIPGVDRSGVSLSVEEHTLIIKAESDKNNDPSWKLLSLESLPGNYCLKLSIDRNIDQEKITATVENGILVLKLPKSQSTLKRNIAIS